MNFRWIVQDNIIPHESIALDASLIHHARTVRNPILRTYTWSPRAISIGSSMRWDLADMDALKRDGVGLVRRTTKGSGILTGDDELNCTLIIPTEWFEERYEKYSPGTAFCLVSSVIGKALESMGVFCEPAKETKTVPIRNLDCFSEIVQCEISVHGRKLVGGAVGYFQKLHVQQFQVSLNGKCLKDIRKYSSVPVEETEHPISVAEAVGHGIFLSDARAKLFSFFSDWFQLDTLFDAPTDSEIEFARTLIETRKNEFWRI